MPHATPTQALQMTPPHSNSSKSKKAHTITTLLRGTANPECIENYHGMYLSRSDVADMVSQIDTASARGEPMPVLVEHKGVSVGRVISAWEHQGRLECVLALDGCVLEGAIGAEMVRSGICRDLSLGYTVSLENSAQRGIVCKKKQLREISVVVKGLRRKCHIHAVSAASSGANSK